MGPNQTYMLLHGKGNHQLTDWEKIFVHDVTAKGFISKIYKQVIPFHNQKTYKQPRPLHNQKKNDPIEKWRGLIQIFLQR